MHTKPRQNIIIFILLNVSFFTFISSNSCSYPCLDCTYNNTSQNATTSCNRCSIGFYLQNFVCISCPNTCLNCDYQQKCIICKDDNKCQFCFSSTGSSISKCPSVQSQTSYLWIVIMIIVFGFCILTTVICCLRKSSRTERQIVVVANNYTNIANITFTEPTLTLRELENINNCQWNKNQDNGEFDFVSECPICQQKGSNTITICRHAFHSFCLREWLTRNKNCPMCRKQEMYYFKVFCDSCHYYYIQLTEADLFKVKKTNQTITCSFCKFI